MDQGRGLWRQFVRLSGWEMHRSALEVTSAPALGYCDWRLGLDAIAPTIAMPANQDPVITASVMHTFANLLLGNLKLTAAVWAHNNHRLLHTQTSLLRNESKQSTTVNGYASALNMS
jgi:hypothetical protein